MLRTNSRVWAFLLLFNYSPRIMPRRGFLGDQCDLDPGHFSSSSPGTLTSLQPHRPPASGPLHCLLPRPPRTLSFQMFTGLSHDFIQASAQMPPPQRGLPSHSLQLSSLIFLGGACHHVTLMQLMASRWTVGATRTMSGAWVGASPASCRRLAHRELSGTCRVNTRIGGGYEHCQAS